MDSVTIKRASLGRIARLGDLYDARSDMFCGVNLLKEQPLESAVTLTDNNFTDLNYIQSESFSEKFSKLDVNAELSISVLAGLIQVDGSARFLRDEKKSARVLRSSLHYSIKTKVEQLNLANEKIQACLSLDNLRNEAATHCVVEIYWGANAVVTSEASTKNNSNTQLIEGSLQASMDKLALSISGKAEVDIAEEENETTANFSLKVIGDVLTGGDELPQTYSEALSFLKRLPLLIRSVNNGKGKPLQYAMIPLSVLRKQFQINIKRQRLLYKINEDAILRFIQLFDAISVVKQKLNDLHSDVTESSFCISDGTIRTIVQLKADFESAEAEICKNLAKILCEVRSGAKNASELDSLLVHFQKSNFAPVVVQDQIRLHSAQTTNWINLVRGLIENGVYYIGRDKSLDAVLLENAAADEMVILYHAHKDPDPEHWKTNWEYFLRLVRGTDEEKKKKKAIVFAFVDSRITSFPGFKDVSCIVQYKQGYLTTSDLCGDLSTTERHCLVESSNVTYVGSKPNKRVVVELRCPRSFGAGPCNKDTHTWLCRKCKDAMEYGFDQKFYCSCGAAPITSYKFKCNSDRHRIDFVKFPEQILKDLVDQLRPLKEVNILVLGETGVGKSTWINAFANYLAYPSLQEAEASDIISLIATSFTMTDENYQEKLVTTGSDTNEVQVAGQSATQGPKSYTFPGKSFMLRLIDTPGIGDTRGIVQDKENFQKIMSHLSYFDEIHGVCILLKPNNSRLNVMFSFCIKELLTNLHRDVSRNIVFCFTNSRGTFYRPGDTLPALKKLLTENKEVEIPLSKDTMYCLDNESFRFLAAVKNGIKFSDDERNNYAASWKTSAVETNRLLEHVASLKPHAVKNTLSLNNARRMIVELTKPLADIAQNISVNIAVLKDREEEVKQLAHGTADLKGKLYVPVIDLQPENLPYPTTVCTAAKCIQVKVVNNIQKIDYTTRCHVPCKIRTQSEIINNRELRRCKAMGFFNGLCKRCGCPWGVHMHITYENKQIFKEVPDDNILSQIANKEQDIRNVRTNIKTLQDRVKQQEDEQWIIAKVSSKFAHFLKHSAIAPYNDALESYLDYLIDMEGSKVHVGGNNKALDALKSMMKLYKEEKDILDKAMSENDTSLTSLVSAAEIQSLVEQLYQLPLNGENLKKSVQLAFTASAKQIQFHEEAWTPADVKKERNNFFRFF